MRVIARLNVGGPALQIAGLARNLDESRFDHRIFAGEVGPGEADFIDLRARDVNVQRVRGLGRSPLLSDDLVAFWSLVRAMRDFEPHIVHTHTAKAGALGRIAADVARVPARVHTFHGHLLHGYFPPVVTAAVRITERALARRSDRLLAVGMRVRDDLLRAGIGRAEQYVVVPPGVEAPAALSRREARSLLGLDEDGVVVAFVARLTAVKRPDRLLDVIRAVLKREPAVVFLIVGEGPLLDETRAHARDVASSVHFLGWRGDVGNIYSAADIALLTSDNEGMPVSLIEASMAGVPCVTTDVGSAAEVVLTGETGYVAGADPESLAEAVVKLVRDAQLRKRMSDAARFHATKSFGIERLVETTERLYSEIAAAT